MPKTLVLKRRMEGRWLDDVVLANAIESLAKGKSMAKAALWLSISAKIQLAKEAAQDDVPQGERLEQFEVELSNKEARVLWKNLTKLSLDAFGRTQDGKDALPPILELSRMLSSFSTQLGQKMPSDGGDDEDEDDEDEDIEPTEPTGLPEGED
jgi:hypothetical protein